MAGMVVVKTRARQLELAREHAELPGLSPEERTRARERLREASREKTLAELRATVKRKRDG